LQVYLNEITGIPDAITSMFMSKRTWTREKEEEIRNICRSTLNPNGSLHRSAEESDIEQLNKWFNTLCKWGAIHTTMLRFIDFSFTVEGLHRGGQDDLDSHAKRFENRIIRSSTRLATFDYEMSDWYKDKIIPTDMALMELAIDTPNIIVCNGITFVKTTNGYIREDLKDNKDAKRGLYMLSIPSNFIFKVNLTEYSHVYKERNINSSANEELKLCIEETATQLERFHSQFNRELFMKIKN